MSLSIALAAGAARVEIAPEAGGAVAAFVLGGADVLRRTDAAARAAGEVGGHACYPLVPYSNRIADARLAFDGGVRPLRRKFGAHPHALHGVGWQRPWTVVAHDAASALLALEHVAAGAAAGAAADWPWPFRATQSFAIRATDRAATLDVKLTLVNTGDAPFPFGLGFHPFFPKSAATELGFRAGALWETDATQLPTRAAAVEGERCFDPPRRVGDVALDNVYSGWTGTATLVDRDRRIAVAIDADSAAGFLVVYVPPGGDCLAVEPVTHLTDAFNRAARGEAGNGARVLPAGAAFSCTMRLSASVLP